MAYDQPESDRLLNVGALAARLGLPEKRIRHAIRSGELPAFQIGAWRRVRLGDARAWLEGQRFRPDNRQGVAR